MKRDEQEMALWRCVYEHWFPRHGYEPEECSGIADAAVEQFRKRYPPQAVATPAKAPEAVWYDEPPFPRDYATRPCWIAGAGQVFAGAVYWDMNEWRMYAMEERQTHSLAGRRVCPIVKPPEPNT